MGKWEGGKGEMREGRKARRCEGGKAGRWESVKAGRWIVWIHVAHIWHKLARVGEISKTLFK